MSDDQPHSQTSPESDAHYVRPKLAYDSLKLSFDGIGDHHPIWNSVRLRALTEFVHTHPFYLPKVVQGERFTDNVRTVMLRGVRNTGDTVILRIFWEEFKLIRNQWRSVYNTAIEQQLDKDSQPLTLLSGLLQKYNISTTDESHVLDALEAHLESNNAKTLGECKICYSNSINSVFVHESHACAVCNKCVERLGTNAATHSCPFCKTSYQRVVKLCIP